MSDPEETDAHLIDENKAVVKNLKSFFREEKLHKRSNAVVEGDDRSETRLPAQCTLTCVSKQQEPIQQVKEISGLETPTAELRHQLVVLQ